MAISNEPVITRPPDAGIQVAIVAERYRYIVSELLRLNGNTHRNLNLFRTIVPVILTPGIYAAFFCEAAKLRPSTRRYFLAVFS
jgi:hypothetical protein